MRHLGSLLAAYSVVWIGIFVYLLRLTKRTRRLESELEALQRASGSES